MLSILMKNRLDIPIVQLSLLDSELDSEEPDQHYREGRALESLRDEGVLIIGPGMATHNLGSFRAARAKPDHLP